MVHSAACQAAIAPGRGGRSGCKSGLSKMIALPLSKHTGMGELGASSSVYIEGS